MCLQMAESPKSVRTGPGDPDRNCRSLCAVLLGWMLIVSLAAGSVAGQDTEPAGTNVEWVSINEDQVNLITEELGRLDPDSRTPGAMIQLSRLLSDPSDQIGWLNHRIDVWAQSSVEADILLARKLEKMTRSRLGVWETRSDLVSIADPLRAELTRLRRLVSPELYEITDEVQLDERLAELIEQDPEALKNLDDEKKLILLARGVPEKHLGLTADRRAESWDHWDQPRLVVEDLTIGTKGGLPAFHKLIDLDRGLRAARGKFEGAPQGADATFRIAEALLARAMGLDGIDRGAPEDDNPQEWAALADHLTDGELWSWAALAELLEAACSTNDEARVGAADQGRTLWRKYRYIEKKKLERREQLGQVTVIRAAIDEWWDRLRDQSTPLEVDGKLPLSSDYRSAARDDRVKLERDFLEEVRPGNPDSDRAFAIMQQAKAAEAGIDLASFQPVTIDQLQRWFKPASLSMLELHLYLELFHVTGSDYWGLVVGAENAELSTTSRYRSVLLGPMADPADVLRGAVQFAGLKSDTKAKVVIAPDRGIGSEKGLQTFEMSILAYLGGGVSGDSWLVYVPTANALADNHPWTLERTLRHWHQLADDGPVRLDVRRAGRGVKSMTDPLTRADKMYVVRFGGKFPRNLPSVRGEQRNFLKLLAKEKKQQKPDEQDAAGVMPFVLH